MSNDYEELMVQHGGYIPFNILGSGRSGGQKRTNKKKKKSRTKPKPRKPKPKKRGRERTIRREMCVCKKDLKSDNPSRNGYCAQCLSNGVIIRGPTDILWKVDNKRWSKI